MTIKNLKNFFIGYYSLIKSINISNENEKERILIEVLKYLPNNRMAIHTLAKLSYENKDWISSMRYWDILFENGKLSLTDFLHYSRAAYFNQDINKSLKILKIADKKFPNSEEIIKDISNVYYEIGDYEEYLKYYKVLVNDLSCEISSETYLKLGDVYQKLNLLNDAEECLKSGIKAYPQVEKLYYKLAEVLMLKRDLATAINLLENECPINSREISLFISVLYKISGDHLKANSVFDTLCNQEVAQEAEQYRKYLLFDNGESRIEFYKCLTETTSIIVTFDSINMEWDANPFAFKILREHNLDILAVRKRKKKTYQQDLTQNDFFKIASPILSGYTDKMAYGFSLGAYSALYFASLLNCRILALSPRLSIHPIYGRTKIIPQFKMEHNIELPNNTTISPIVVFDPKNALDNKYIRESVLTSFPNSILIETPYIGHGVAPQLLKMGLLKKFVIDFINMATPSYDREKAKIYSTTYYVNLGTECLNRNKLHWALNLADKAIERSPKDIHAIKLKIKVLIKMDNYKEAAVFTKKAIQKKPNTLDIRLYLIDIYIKMGEIEKARLETTSAQNKFKKNKSITKRQHQLTSLS
ncbi:tetratricopeptide repeat protein [Bhargavaea beijingensis]|uniref:tetratricopeptide repeat protein n=1 Tax=Bhargavaea beijingensis TaxID=426756 RepID=UPI002224737D|nr:tetratricopeptide repeat protein [Bhargavaea beijingensis]MCW1928850.1 tetratricopeptide repeat protein [Bhargavaea beijingensis]